MQVSYSRVSTYKNCPHQFKLRYVDGLETIFNCDPQNALILGHALHTGIEKDVETAIKEYYSAYPVIKDAHVTEAMKLEYLIPKVKAMLPKGQHELYIETPDFHGYMDLLVPVKDKIPLEERDEICFACNKRDECDYCDSGHCPYGKHDTHNMYDLYDFKYSNNVAGYMDSAQLHLYKYFFELTNPGKRIRNLYFVFIPKCMLKQKYQNKTNKRDETIYEFRKRCMEDLKSKEIQIRSVQYDPYKVIEYLLDTKHCVEDTEYIKAPSRLCNWCEYQLFCEKGIDYMNLPKNERREIVLNTTPDMWIYADSYVGKSTFIDQLDDLIFANTDGNTENITSPVVRIKNEKDGRVTKLAWEVFLEFVAELEKKENDFKVVALDLVEDLYEHCRLYIYDKLSIEHEQDAGFGKGWDMVRTEFLTTIKRLKNLGYRIIYISKELKTEINLKNGAKITSYAPNIPDKVANVLAGTVTLTVRAYMNNRGRFLQLAKEENIFGGGRFDFVNATCPLDMGEFVKELTLAQGDAKPATTEEAPSKRRNARKSEKPAESAESDGVEPATVEDDKANDLETDDPVEVDTSSKITEETLDVTPAPTPRRRRRREE